jgi:hypothetical protein
METTDDNNTHSPNYPIYLAGSDHQTGESVNLTGNWFIYFGANLPDCSIEGSRILSLKGNFNPDTLLDVLVDNIYNDLPEKGKEMLEAHKARIVIRAFNRIG